MTVKTYNSQVSMLNDPAGIIFVPVIMMKLWTYMFYANELTETSKQLLFSLEQSNWPDMSVPNKKNLILAQEGMIQPIQVMCYKWFNLSLDVFTTVSTQVNLTSALSDSGCFFRLISLLRLFNTPTSFLLS